MTIQEQLYAINKTFLKLHDEFARFDVEKQALEGRFASERIRVQDKWKAEKDKMIVVKEDVLKYYRIAKDNSRKDLASSGVAGQRPDISRLNSMVEKINIRDRNDVIAGQIIDLASQYVAYLDKEISKLSDKEQAESKNLDQHKDHEISRLAQQRKQVLVNCEQFLRGENIAKLVQLFDDINHDYAITDAFFKNWDQPVRRKRMMLFGFQQFPLDVPQMLCHILKSHLQQHFDESNKNVNCPCGFTTDSHEEIYVEYVDRNETLMKQGIQALILNFMRNFGQDEFRVSLLDYIHYNADIIGPLAALSVGKNGVIGKSPSDVKTLQQNIAILAEYYRKVEAKIGTESIYQYNKRHIAEERIPIRLLILNRMDDAYRTNDNPEMAYIINNAAKFGITFMQLSKSQDGGSKGKDREQKYLANSKDCIRIISDTNGGFYIENNVEWRPFQWMSAPSYIPSEFVSKVLAASTPKGVGSKYFSRYGMTVPSKSKGQRKPLSIPFAIDEDDNVINCNFENDSFAAYIMGAAGSGKSTLLHTIISGLIMNYHPDEVELWLMDFKMLEFKRYVDHCPPHVKYILLEKSEDLVFDIIDHLAALLDERQYFFSRNGWSKLGDVPLEENMPTVFVIIDEFAQMSQILKETRGAGYGSDYTVKLENLLAKGRALGLKFIFASQTYTTGISGLTETACKQIQMRFALKNTPDEIKQTLTLSSDQITPELSRSIFSMPAYETLFKWADENNTIHIERYRNMYTEGNEIETLVEKINSAITPVAPGSRTTDATCIAKKPVLIDGNQPKTFKSQILHYKEYESSLEDEGFDDNDMLIYAGVPCSFNLARPFTLCGGTAENILIAGGDRESRVNILLSILNSYGRKGRDVEIWSHERSSTYRKYGSTVLSKGTHRCDLDDICTQIAQIKKGIQRKTIAGKLIVCFGYELLAPDFEILGDGALEPKKREKVVQQRDNSLPDINEILQRVRECPDPEDKKRIVEEYNRRVAESENAISPSEEDECESFGGVYDARTDMQWILKRASNYGLHFLFCFDQGRDFINLRMDENAFRHKIMFPMSKDESLSIMGSRKANEIDDGTCVYGNGKETFTLRPHIYRGLPCNGWVIDKTGKIEQRG